MSDRIQEIARQLIVGKKRDGRNVYDESVKVALVQACLEPGASVARLARECGVNANQVATWIRVHARRNAPSLVASKEAMACEAESTDFVQMRLAPLASRMSDPIGGLKLHARLPNGVVLDMQCADSHQLDNVIEVLGRVRCSASTKT